MDRLSKTLRKSGNYLFTLYDWSKSLQIAIQKTQCLAVRIARKTTAEASEHYVVQDSASTVSNFRNMQTCIFRNAWRFDVLQSKTCTSKSVSFSPPSLSLPHLKILREFNAEPALLCGVISYRFSVGSKTATATYRVLVFRQYIYKQFSVCMKFGCVYNTSKRFNLVPKLFHVLVNIAHRNRYFVTCVLMCSRQVCNRNCEPSSQFLRTCAQRFFNV